MVLVNEETSAKPQHAHEPHWYSNQVGWVYLRKETVPTPKACIFASCGVFAMPMSTLSASDGHYLCWAWFVLVKIVLSVI